MTLADFFHACNRAGIRLANVAGRLEMRGAIIPSDIRISAAEHKETLLALLPRVPAPVPRPTAISDSDSDAQELAEERAAIQAEAGVSAAALAQVLTEWDTLASRPAKSQWGGPFCTYRTHRVGWLSRYGVEVCATCYPPACPSEQVRNWIWCPSVEGVEALIRLAELSESEYLTK